MVLRVRNVQEILRLDPQPRWLVKLTWFYSAASEFVKELAVPIEDIDYVQLHIAHIDIFLMVELQTVVRAHLCKFDLSSKMPAKIQNLEPGIASVEDEEFIASEHNPRRISELARPISAPAFTEVTQDMTQFLSSMWLVATSIAIPLGA